MSAFKDMVEADIVNVFLNLDELAEIHNLDGVECACVISSDKTGVPLEVIELFVISG